MLFARLNSSRPQNTSAVLLVTAIAAGGLLGAAGCYESRSLLDADGSVARNDSGTPGLRTDAGVFDFDAGRRRFDSGQREVDAGPRRRDAGRPLIDAGPFCPPAPAFVAEPRPACDASLIECLETANTQRQVNRCFQMIDNECGQCIQEAQSACSASPDGPNCLVELGALECCAEASGCQDFECVEEECAEPFDSFRSCEVALGCNGSIDSFIDEVLPLCI